MVGVGERGSAPAANGTWAIAAGVFVLGFLAYGNTFKGEFVWDDASSILLHETVQDPARFFELFREDQHAYGRGQGNFYRPLVAASFMADYAIAHAEGSPAREVNPFVFHLQSVGWHGLTAALLVILMARMGAPTAALIAVPALYVIHPVHTEAVAYISGRADSMAAAFMFAGLIAATHDASAKQRLWAAVVTSAFFVCALLSKESALIFPALLLFCIVARRRARKESAAGLEGSPGWIALGTSVVILVAYGAIRMTVLSFGADGGGSVAAPLGRRLVESFQALALYAELVILPQGLHMERSLDGVSTFAAIPGALFLALCAGAGWWAWRGGLPRVALGLAWFVVTWLPISGIFPLNAPMAEHWLYVPLAGLLWAVVELTLLLTRRRTLLAVAAVVVAVWGVFLFYVTVDRNMDWRGNVPLFTQTLRENPDTFRVRYNLAVTYEDILENPVGARREYGQITEIFSQWASTQPRKARENAGIAVESHLALANLALGDRDLQTARTNFLEAQRIGGEYNLAQGVGEAQLGLGQILMMTGDAEGARQAFANAVRNQPELAPIVERLTGAPG